jgi:hypothetical protein
MLRGNKNVSVLTTYADVDSIASNASAEKTTSSLERTEKNIYAQGGVSNEIFVASGSAAMPASLKNDTAFMMTIERKFAHFITNLINRKFANSNVSFKYTLFPITHHNFDTFADTAFKLAGSGYSFLMPTLALGLTQRDFGNLKDLENKVLLLGEKLIPPSTSYTQSASGTSDGESPNGEGEAGQPVKTDIDVGGRPSKEEGEKADTTLEKEKSLDKNGGGS